MVNIQQVQEFLDARRQACTNPEIFQNARRVLVASDKTEVLAHFETRLQIREEEERASVIAGLAALYGPDAIDTIVRWISDSSTSPLSSRCAVVSS